MVHATEQVAASTMRLFGRQAVFASAAKGSNPHEDLKVTMLGWTRPVLVVLSRHWFKQIAAIRGWSNDTALVESSAYGRASR